MRLEQVHRERLHDARSAVFGVIDASELLAAPGRAGLGRHRLQRMIAAELIRLQDMLDTDVSESIGDFDLAEVLGPVLIAHRIDGAPLRVAASPAGPTAGRGPPRPCSTTCCATRATTRRAPPSRSPSSTAAARS